MTNYYCHHPFDDSPTAPPSPTDAPETMRKLADLTRNMAKATMQALAEPPLRNPDQQATHPFLQAHALPVPPPLVPRKRARQRRGTLARSPQQARVGSKATNPHPPAPAAASPPNPAGTPPNPPAYADWASSLSSPPPQAPPQPDAYPEFQPAARVQKPYGNNQTGNWILCKGTIQYRLKGKSLNGGLQILVQWHCQPQLNQPNAPDKAEDETLELTSAHPMQRVTPDNKAGRGNQYTEEIPPEWTRGLPSTCPPKRAIPGKKTQSPSPLP